MTHRVAQDGPIRHEFVDFIPKELEERVLYVSIKYCTAAHRCFCGCGQKVVTPLSPAQWRLTFDGESVSLHPSVGNWSFRCQSHYWIAHGRVKAAEQLGPQIIAAVRAIDHSALVQATQERAANTTSPAHSLATKPRTFWSWLWQLFS